jgi:hypothetical protein
MRLPARRTLPSDPLFQRLALKKFHGDEMPAFVLVDVVDCADVWVIQGRGRLGFTLESLQRLAVPGQRLGQELQGNWAFEPGVLGLIHYAHSALAQLFDDLIAAGKDRAGGEFFDWNLKGFGRSSGNVC